MKQPTSRTVSHPVIVSALRGWALVAGLVAGIASASAHPHVWVEIDSEILADAREISAVRHRWTFDEGYSEQAVEGLDVNKDGVVDRQELAELAKINMEALPQFGFFTELNAGSDRAAVKLPTEYWLEQQTLPPLKDDPEKRPRKVLVLHFTLPLEQPLPLQPSGVSFAVRDPSFFIAFLTTQKTAVRLAGKSTERCQLAPDEDQRTLSDLAQAMQDAIAKAGDQPTQQPPAPLPDLTPQPSGPRYNQVYKLTCR